MMRANAVAIRPNKVEVRAQDDAETPQSLMTPARAAALDALERELAEFLKGRAEAA